MGPCLPRFSFEHQTSNSKNQPDLGHENDWETDGSEDTQEFVGNYAQLKSVEERDNEWVTEPDLTDAQDQSEDTDSQAAQSYILGESQGFRFVSEGAQPEHRQSEGWETDSRSAETGDRNTLLDSNPVSSKLTIPELPQLEDSPFDEIPRDPSFFVLRFFTEEKMDQGDIPALLSRLSTDEDAMRKMAVFKLQSSINDPAFADVFISSGGLTILRRLIMSTGGNTLAYSLQSLSRLLEVDMGWEIFETAGAGELVERIVELIVQQPLVNILRGAMSILVAIVSHPQTSNGKMVSGAFNYGFRALKPAVAVFPTFFEMVVSQLESADHALCANSLSLLNALMRDSITNDESKGKETAGKGTGAVEEWSKFIKRLQDLGVVTLVYGMMQGSALQDLAHPLLEFQALSKVLLKKWKELPLELEKPDHRRAMKSLHLASAPDRKEPQLGNGLANGSTRSRKGSQTQKGSQRENHNPNKWRRLGFETESPAKEFDRTGYLGMMDLMEFVKRHEDAFQKLLLEQSLRPAKMRCPIARASLAVTIILYEHFDVDKSDVEDAKAYLVLDGMKNYDKIFRPLLLKWPELHTAGLLSFIRLWKATGAQLGNEDFDKVADLTRILIDTVVGQASRQKDVADVEEEFTDWDLQRLRVLQMQLLELDFEEDWGPYLVNIRADLKQDAMQFVKEQRVRCLLGGSWFPRNGQEIDGPWRFVRLSANRRYIHYGDFTNRRIDSPSINELSEKIDLGTVTSVVSNVTAREKERGQGPSESATTLKDANAVEVPKTNTKITVYGQVITDALSQSSKGGERADVAILILYPTTPSLASEWLDGMLMLLNQAPITADTTKIVDFINDYSMRLRLLNVNLNGPPKPGGGVVPSRAGLDENYYYDISGHTYGDVANGKFV